ncbi:uncharacterized protein MYCFIDRAFT_169228 [Pseudocercospora fijiensis CIRAD86]|uniref:Uncharacterized protein n=1 Tax=Pseudocercospora fijiensis (strain CIRAD86) TaxID=383855 RepID=N1Q929_PSEFD|nr:uncharacterized protein MYCFIDRAFT_169228 [Pseudocercospora fijiensis CIRAD86]EME87393.1 hypothetical protein MYCFIDRAFT_169228 [Pseudocercospora fijiensis CIRAD86]
MSLSLSLFPIIIFHHLSASSLTSHPILPQSPQQPTRLNVQASQIGLPTLLIFNIERKKQETHQSEFCKESQDLTQFRIIVLREGFWELDFDVEFFVVRGRDGCGEGEEEGDGEEDLIHVGVKQMQEVFLSDASAYAHRVDTNRSDGGITAKIQGTVLHQYVYVLPAKSSRILGALHRRDDAKKKCPSYYFNTISYSSSCKCKLCFNTWQRAVDGHIICADAPRRRSTGGRLVEPFRLRMQRFVARSQLSDARGLWTRSQKVSVAVEEARVIRRHISFLGYSTVLFKIRSWTVV